MAKQIQYGFLMFLICAVVACNAQPEPTPPSPTEAPTVIPPTANPEPEPEGSATIPSPTITDDPSGATISVYEFDGMTLHAFTNPPAGLGNGTYIVEGDTSLVLIDSHFTDESAQAFRDYADSIGKPIDRIYVTHEHPDHINGLVTVFADIDSYAPSSVAEEFDTVGNTQEAGTRTIDGINYEFEIFLDGESHEALVIKLPDYGVMATGDVLYNGYHMVMNPNIPNWIEQIATLEAMGDYQLLLPGHGAPTDPSFYAVATEYLKTAQGFYEELDSGEEFKAAMLEAYPDAAVEFYLDLSVGALYPKSDQ